MLLFMGIFFLVVNFKIFGIYIFGVNTYKDIKNFIL